ncbi:S-layer homology domain-containing protein [Cohnella abietis]|uniref:SLH domain-containing protein n=1 Tax=Cohnella abietis TaxID=2507935 RepID=A0A3T1D1I5_9BACL|nr:S-layer homology domain-containing protein [Cohnella abietis]BBI31956.1 hypothetical protein KCTCHS21_13550 [Cohnella abietis]
MKITRWISLFAVISLLFTTLFSVHVFAASSSSYSLQPSSSTIIAGDEFTITISGNRLMDLFGYEVNVSYDTGLLQFQGAVNSIGGFAIEPIVQQGKITFAGTKIGQAQGDSGTATLCTLRFKAVASGIADITLTSVKEINSQLMSTTQLSNTATKVTVNSVEISTPNDGVSVSGTTIVKIQDSIAVVNVEANRRSVSIPIREIGELPVSIRTGSLTINIKAELLKALKKQLGNSEGALLEVMFPPVDNINAVETVLKKNKAKVNIVGEVFDVSISLKATNGHQVIAEQVGSNVELIFSYKGNVLDAKLLGIYYINSDLTNWEYIDSIVNAQTETVTATLTHLSQYALVEYNKSFSDIPSTHWAFRTIQILAAKHIVNGVTIEEFNPNKATTRAEFTSLLVRALDLKASSFQGSSFVDVTSDAWYAKDVEAAYTTGLVNGVSKERFMPDAVMTREQMAASILRAFKWKNKQEVQPVNARDTFKDDSGISSWAREDVHMALTTGLMKGKPGNVFQPKSATSRVEAAQAIMNLLTVR